MNKTIILLTGLFLTTIFAGCIGGDDTVDSEEDDIQERPDEIKVSETTGSIKGTVASDLFEALGGAQVLLTEIEVQTTVARNGEFVMNDLEPGTYTLVASALGYEQALRSVRVVAGEITEVSIVMVPAESDDPYAVAFEEVGTVTIAAAWQAEIPGVGCTNVDVVKNCGGIRLGTNSEHTVPSGPDVKTIMAEMVWDPAGPLGETLSLDVMCDDVPRNSQTGAVLEIDHPCFFETTSQTSPIIHRIDEEHWIEHGYNYTAPWTTRIFGTHGALGTYDATGIDIGAAYEQKFTVYYTVFHKEPAPEGFSGIPDA